MFPIRAGMRLRQPAAPGRVFRVTGEPTGEGDDRLWPLELVEALASDTRQPGFVTSATDEWLFRHTEPTTLGVPAPCGDGIQVVRTPTESRTFTTAAEAVAWATSLAEADPEAIIEWFGWPIHEGDGSPADLIVRWVDDEGEDGEVVWLEPVA